MTTEEVLDKIESFIQKTRLDVDSRNPECVLRDIIMEVRRLRGIHEDQEEGTGGL